MSKEKMGCFIKKIREEKGWSQEKLANGLYCDRTKINKIENGKRSVSIDDLILLSEIFEISIEELISGKRKDKENFQEIEITFKKYLKSQNTKFKRMRLIMITLSLLLLFCFSVFTTVYFVHNYESIRFYKFNGSSESYEINDGVLILSKGKMYLSVGSVIPDVEKISIYSEIDSEKKLIYEGRPDILLHDSYGYSSYISYDDFIGSKQRIYIVINDEKIELKFYEDYVNDKFFFDNSKKIGKQQETSKTIPNKIKELFICDSNSCTLNSENETLIFNNNMFYVSDKEKKYSYDLENNVLEYQDKRNSKENFTILISNDNIICITEECRNTEKIYKKFYNSYILKYIK